MALNNLISFLIVLLMFAIACVEPCDIVVSGGEHVDVVIGAAVADGKVTPKVQSLIKILLKYQDTDDFRAIVFVERVVAALVLPKVDIQAYSPVLDASRNNASFLRLFCRGCRSLQNFNL